MIARLLISSSLDKIKEETHLHLKGANVNHPDVLYFRAGEKLGVAQARQIKEHFFLKPYSLKGKVVIIEDASVMTPEAQNALLKTLEEPPEEAVLILGAPSDANLLPTILSRCEIVVLTDRLEYNNYNNYKDYIEKLINYSTEERFDYIEKLKNRKEFLAALTGYFHQKLPENLEFAKELLQVEEWAKQNVNLRGILEYLMLKMPKSI